MCAYDCTRCHGLTSLRQPTPSQSQLQYEENNTYKVVVKIAIKITHTKNFAHSKNTRQLLNFKAVILITVIRE